MDFGKRSHEDTGTTAIIVPYGVDCNAPEICGQIGDPQRLQGILDRDRA